MLRVNKKDKYVVSGFVNKTEYGRSTLMEISGDIEVKTVPEKRSSWINNSIGLDIIG